MPLKFGCKNCGNDIVVRFLKPGEGAKCRNCGTVNVVPSDVAVVEEEEEQAKHAAANPGVARVGAG